MRGRRYICCMAEAGMNTETITLYRFMPLKHLQQSLARRRFKVTPPDQLNDPFESYPGVLNLDVRGVDDRTRGLSEKYMKRASTGFAIDSYSATCSSPLLWAHYADKHRGVALCFEMPLDNALVAVRYSRQRPCFDARLVNSDTPEVSKEALHRAALAAGTTKSLEWAYEEEYRRLIDLSKADGEPEYPDGPTLYFCGMPADHLSGIILGMECACTHGEAKAILVSAGFVADIPIGKAQRHGSEFTVVINWIQSPS